MFASLQSAFKNESFDISPPSCIPEELKCIVLTPWVCCKAHTFIIKNKNVNFKAVVLCVKTQRFC
jgi:hypothetical protein